ncbi:unnamed protein product [Soboliphyme baturini]|uniref:SRP_SPB domain-containing protein n=1 Tax=Soboliphyme baturini TaxID=241478 RepID=A0A183J6C6_9BILA|nr:unnamed protein product [Soboliphyme baturini]
MHIYNFRLKAEHEEETRRRRLQIYVCVARCIAYNFNAKQQTDIAKRLPKVTKQELGRIKERFGAFVRGEIQIVVDEAFTNVVQSFSEVLNSDRTLNMVLAGGFSASDFRELFRKIIEKRLKETVINSWMAKFEYIYHSEEENVGRKSKPRCAQNPNADAVLSNEQLYDLFQQILGVKKFEHQLIFNALQLDNPDEQAAVIRRELDSRIQMVQEMAKDRKLMPKFVVKDMETLYLDEMRSAVNLLVSNLESVPVNPKGSSLSKKSFRARSRSRCCPYHTVFILPFILPLGRDTTTARTHFSSTGK